MTQGARAAGLPIIIIAMIAWPIITAMDVDHYIPVIISSSPGIHIIRLVRGIKGCRAGGCCLGCQRGRGCHAWGCRGPYGVGLYLVLVDRLDN